MSYEEMQTAENSTALKNEPKAASKSNEDGNKKNASGKLENYDIRQNIGEGAFGSVNLAIQKSNNMKVAIKAVNIMRICELNKERHILREKDLLNDLKHPNIIQLFTTFKVSKFL